MEATMTRLDLSLALALALMCGTACAGPQRDRGEQAAPSDDEQVADQFRSEAREALDELNDEFRELETTNANLQGESATAWAETREQILQVRQELETDLDRLEGATTDEADDVRARVADSFETMTHHLERAKLLATDDNQEFVTAARNRLAEADRGIQSLQAEAARLPMQAREEVSQSVESLRSEANDVRETVMSFSNAAPQDIAEQREEVAEEVAALSASVRRETFEMQAELDN
jgi:hypothetical protein